MNNLKKLSYRLLLSTKQQDYDDSPISKNCLQKENCSPKLK